MRSLALVVAAVGGILLLSTADAAAWICQARSPTGGWAAAGTITAWAMRAAARCSNAPCAPRATRAATSPAAS